MTFNFRKNEVLGKMKHIFDQNIDLWQNLKIAIFDKKIRFLTKIFNFFTKNSDFWKNIFGQNCYFYQNIRFLTKISSFEKNSDFRQNSYFWQKLQFLATIPIFCQYIFKKIQICEQNFEFKKIRFSTKLIFLIEISILTEIPILTEIQFLAIFFGIFSKNIF